MKLVCLGDSLTFGYKISQSQSWPVLLGKKFDIEVLNKGINGDTTSGLLSRFYRDVVEQRASHVIVMGGTNDLIWRVPVSTVEAQMATIVQHAYYHGIMPIIGIPIPVDTEAAKRFWPFVNNFDEVNHTLTLYREWVFEFSRNFKCGYIDFYRYFYDFELFVPKKGYYLDGIHPTVEGNRLMADAVEL